MECSGKLWEALGSSGMLWEALGSSGMLWDALGCSGMLWDALGCSETLKKEAERKRQRERAVSSAVSRIHVPDHEFQKSSIPFRAGAAHLHIREVMVKGVSDFLLVLGLFLISLHLLSGGK